MVLKPGDEEPFIGRFDIMINVGELYSDNQEIDHEQSTIKNVDEKVLSTDAAAHTSPPTAKEIEMSKGPGV